MATGLVTGGVIDPTFTDPVSVPVEDLQGTLTDVETLHEDCD